MSDMSSTTTPTERAQALLDALDFVLKVRALAGTLEQLKHDARYVLRHYPERHELARRFPGDWMDGCMEGGQQPWLENPPASQGGAP